MPKYKVWDPDLESEEDALQVAESSPGLAGEVYMSQVWDGHSDSRDLMASDEDGNYYEITVDIDYEPHFSSYSRKLK